MESFRVEALRFTRTFPPEHNLTVIDRSGQQLLNTGAAPDQPLPQNTNAEAARIVFSTSKPYVSNVFTGALLKRPIVAVYVPTQRGAETIYNLSFNPPLGRFRAIIRDQRLPRDWVISIFDRSGKHIARQPALETRELTTAAPSLWVELANKREGVAETVTLEGIHVLTAFSRSDSSGWIVAIGIPTETIAGPARQTAYLTFAAGFSLILVGFLFAARMAAQIARAEGRRQLLINELNHRVKNTLVAVQSIVTRTMQGSSSMPEAKAAIEGRLLALSQAHNLLSDTNWENAEFGALARGIIEPYLPNPDQAAVRGPALRVQPRVAVAIALVLNELATNAAKYGALSRPNGVITLVWRQENQHLRLDWEERGGPPVIPPVHAGFGTRFIERAIAQELKGVVELAYPQSGLKCTITVPL